MFFVVLVFVALVVHQVPAAVEDEPSPTEVGSQAKGAIEPLHKHALYVRDALVIERSVFSACTDAIKSAME